MLRAVLSATALVLAMAIPAPAPAQTSADRPDIRVILLGTGGPELSFNRDGYSTLVEAGGQELLFDAGRGVLQRLFESGVNVTTVHTVFFTHLHNDHTEGLPNLWLTPWFLLGRTTPLQITGPVGTARMVAGMKEMFWFDVEHRVNAFNKLSDLLPAVKEMPLAGGVVYDRDGVRVTSFPVEHGDGDPAYGYQIAYRNRIVVLSGDTTYHPNVVKYGLHADLIVHNVIAMSDRLTHAPEMIPVLAKLTTPEQAARVFLETSPRLAVFSHVVKKELHGIAGDEIIMERVRAAGYHGPLAMGYDRTVIEIGDAIRLIPPTETDLVPDVDRKAAYPDPQ